MNELPPPYLLGAPEAFQEWRPAQARAMLALMSSSRRFDVAALPTGVGKSLIGAVYPAYQGARAVILTATRPLQDQYLRLFASMGMVDVRGMQNYPCRLLVEDENKPKAVCSDGPCLEGYSCRYRDRGCPYYDRVAEAARADIVVTNYAFWFQMKRSKRPDALGQRDILICDEAHDVAEVLNDFLRVELTTDDVYGLPGEEAHVWSREEWITWCHEQRIVVTQAQQGVSLERRRQLRETLMKLDMVLSYGGRAWVADYSTREWKRVWTFEPVWPAPFAEEWLWRGVPRIILLSATVRPKALAMVGLKAGSYGFHEAPSPFPIARRPVIHIPTLRLNHRTTDGELLFWLARADQIIGRRTDRKGIFHTVSYARAKLVKGNSAHASMMVLPTTKTTARDVEAFKQSSDPQVLVSPAVHTGYDFPLEACEYQIVGKVPFPDMRGKLGQARKKDDPSYEFFVAANTIVQASGRGNREDGDYCETFIIDDNIQWLVKKYREFFPRYWLDAYRVEASVPAPGRKL